MDKELTPVKFVYDCFEYWASDYDFLTERDIKKILYRDVIKNYPIRNYESKISWKFVSDIDQLFDIAFDGYYRCWIQLKRNSIIVEIVFPPKKILEKYINFLDRDVLLRSKYFDEKRDGYLL